MRPLTLSLSIAFGLSVAACSGGSENAGHQQTVSASTHSKPPVTKIVETSKPEVIEVYNFDVENGRKFYKKCTACHQANGNGIPGSFPALNVELDKLVASPEGRAYLILVVQNGLRGQLERNDGTFNGMMVRQAGGKKASDVADVLNYVFKTFYDDESLIVFSAAEVSAVNEKNGRLNGNKVLALRPELP